MGLHVSDHHLETTASDMFFFHHHLETNVLDVSFSDYRLETTLFEVSFSDYCQETKIILLDSGSTHVYNFSSLEYSRGGVAAWLRGIKDAEDMIYMECLSLGSLEEDRGSGWGWKRML